MEENKDLTKILLAALIEELGGVVRLDAVKILADLKEGRFKEIGLQLKDDVVILEVFEEDE